MNVESSEVAPSTLALRVGLPTASHYQIAIFEEVERQVRNLLADKPVVNIQVQAVAGAGKTKTIECCAKLIPDHLSTGFFAFNKDIAGELRGRLPWRIDVKTLHALGLSIWSRFIQGRERVSLGPPDSNKIRNIMKDVMSFAERKSLGVEVRFFVDMARNHGVVPADLVGKGYDNASDDHADTDGFWQGIADHFGFFMDPDKFEQAIDFAREILRRDIKQDTTIDFTDMLYLPIITRVGGVKMSAFKKYDVVVIDEVQDLNPAQQALLGMVLKPGGLLVCVGDENQSIYGFTGADTRSMERLREKYDCMVKPLSITYRCGKKIVERAQQVYDNIEAAPEAADGEVTTFGQFKADMFKPGDLVICRNNAPLIKFAYRLISNRIPVRVLGRDLGADLIRIIDKLPHRNSVIGLAEALIKWKEQQISIIRRQDPEDEEGVQKITDKYDVIMIFVTESHAPDVETIKTEMQDLFAERKEAGLEGKVILSTIHKAKGGEAVRVFWLDAFLMYPRYVREDTWQYVQERNLEYVGITRAKLLLGYISSDMMLDSVARDLTMAA